MTCVVHAFVATQISENFTLRDVGLFKRIYFKKYQHVFISLLNEYHTQTYFLLYTHCPPHPLITPPEAALGRTFKAHDLSRRQQG